MNWDSLHWIQLRAAANGLPRVACTGFSDAGGRFEIVDVPYGKYLLTAAKEGCVPASQVIEHIGGYSPTISEIWIYQIPPYSLIIDSVRIAQRTDSNSAFLYGQLENYSMKAYIGIIFLCFVDTIPDVDADHYNQKMIAFAFKDDIAKNHMKAVINNEYGFQSGKVLYLRAYPMSWSENLYNFHKEYLGSPSNLVSFTLDF